MKTLLLTATFFLSFAQAAERPISRTINDKTNQWGDCPALFPKGCKLSVLHGSPEKANTDIFFKVPGGYKIPPHTHTSAEHMTLVSGMLEVKYKGEEKVMLRPGSYAFGPAEHAHEATCTSQDDCVLFISFDLPIDAKPYKGNI
jgi:quercetin dioxygenase-like cupin family protein